MLCMVFYRRISTLIHHSIQLLLFLWSEPWIWENGTDSSFAYSLYKNLQWKECIVINRPYLGDISILHQQKFIKVVMYVYFHWLHVFAQKLYFQRLCKGTWQQSSYWVFHYLLQCQSRQLMHCDTLKQDNDSTVRGDGGSRVGEVRAGTTSPMPEHKGFKLQ